MVLIRMIPFINSPLKANNNSQCEKNIEKQLQISQKNNKTTKIKYICIIYVNIQRNTEKSENIFRR